MTVLPKIVDPNTQAKWRPLRKITRIRDDKTIQEASTIGQVREIYERQFRNKGKYSTQENIRHG